MVTGARGFIGTVLTRALRQTGAELSSPRRGELDVGDTLSVETWVREFPPSMSFTSPPKGSASRYH